MVLQSIEKEAPAVVGSTDREHTIPAFPTLGTKSCATFGFAWFLVVFSATHFLFDPASLHQLAETANSLLDRLAVPN